jgi:hypothetical protein
MQKQTEFGLRPAIAAVTFAASAIVLAPASNAAPAETCLGAPKGAAPKGSHWYYHLERPSMRKCWYLAEKGRKTAQRAAVRSAPQAEPDEEPDTESAAPAPAANTAAVPIASTPAAPAAGVPSVPAAQPQPVITTLVTRNVSNADQIAQEQAPAAPNAAQSPAAPDPAQPTAPSAAASTMATAVPALEQAPSDQQAVKAAAEAPAPQAAAVAADEQAASTGAVPTLQLLLGAIALIGLLACVGLFVMATLRRRNDVLNRWRDTAALPFEDSPDTAAGDSPAFGPMPALDTIRQRDLEPIRQHDEVDVILQRLARRRAA